MAENTIKKNNSETSPQLQKTAPPKNQEVKKSVLGRGLKALMGASVLASVPTTEKDTFETDTFEARSPDRNTSEKFTAEKNTPEKNAKFESPSAVSSSEAKSSDAFATNSQAKNFESQQIRETDNKTDNTLKLPHASRLANPNGESQSVASGTPFHESQVSGINSSKQLESLEESTKGLTNLEQLLYLDLEELRANSTQPRTNFKSDELQELANSIKASGLIQPIIVRPLYKNNIKTPPTFADGSLSAGSGKTLEVSGLAKNDSSSLQARFEIVAGERRFRAAKIAGLTKVPVIVRRLSAREVLELAIIENVQRSDLNPIEEALSYQRLIEEFGANQQDVAETVGKDRVTISNTLRLLKLDPEVRGYLISEKLSAGHARALIPLEASEQVRISKKIIQESLSVRAVEQLVKNGETPAAKRTISPKPSSLKLDQLEIEDKLRRTLGTKVSLKINDKGRGELRVNFFSQPELERIMEKLGVF